MQSSAAPRRLGAAFFALAFAASCVGPTPAQGLPGGDARRARQALGLSWVSPMGSALDFGCPLSEVKGARAAFSGLAEAGLVLGPVDGTGRLRHGDRDGPFLEASRVTLLAEGEPNPRLRLHLQVDALSARDRHGGPRLSEAWVFRRNLAGVVGGRFGAFAPPFSLEHGGAGRTTELTITPSALNTFLEGIRLVGVEWRKCPEPKPNHFSLRVAAGRARDDAALAVRPYALDDRTGAVDRAEGEARRAYYLYIGKSHSDSCRHGRWGWHAGFFDLAGDGGSEASTHLGLFSVDFFLARIGFILQIADGTARSAGGPAEDVRCLYLMAHGRLGRRHTASLRFDDWNRDVAGGPTIDGGHAWTAAVNRPLPRRGALLQVEWLRAEPAAGLEEGDRLQVRYRFRF